MSVNFLTGAVLFGVLGDALQNPQLMERWTKLIMAPPFVLGAAAAGVLLLLWNRGWPTVRRRLGLDQNRPLPAGGAPRRWFRAPEVWIVLLFLLPASVQVLGAQLETLSRIAFPYPEFYATLQELLSPKGHWLDLLGALLTLALIGPVCEELLFRGMILGGFLRAAEDQDDSPTVSRAHRLFVLPLLFQALVFAVIHMNPWQFAYALPMGFLLGWLRVRTGSLWPCIVLHCGNNLAAVLMVYFAPPIQFLNSGIYSSIEHVPLSLLCAAAIVCALSIYLLHRRAEIVTFEKGTPGEVLPG